MKFWHAVAALALAGLVYLVTETLYHKYLEKYIP